MSATAAQPLTYLAQEMTEALAARPRDRVLLGQLVEEWRLTDQEDELAAEIQQVLETEGKPI